MRDLFQRGAALRGIGRGIVDLANERGEAIGLQDRHRPDAAICVVPPRQRGHALGKIAEETGRRTAALDIEKTLQRDAGISNIVLA